MDDNELESTSQILLTAEGHARLKDELQRLSVDKRAEIAERIRDSKDRGEFSEDNSELDEVKIEQAMVENRISELKAMFANAAIINKRKISTKEVALGARVTVKDKRRRIEFEIRIVSSVEANPDEDLISDESPLGQALLGKAVGDIVRYSAPAGDLRYEITNIRR